MFISGVQNPVFDTLYVLTNYLNIISVVDCPEIFLKHVASVRRIKKMKYITSIVYTVNINQKIAALQHRMGTKDYLFVLVLWIYWSPCLWERKMKRKNGSKWICVKLSLNNQNMFYQYHSALHLKAKVELYAHGHTMDAFLQSSPSIRMILLWIGLNLAQTLPVKAKQMI